MDKEDMFSGDLKKFILDFIRIKLLYNRKRGFL